jgi:hypothetical protein
MSTLDSSKELVRLVNEINNNYHRLNKELSKIDLVITDLLHEIQNTNFSASHGYMLALELKQLRLSRHSLKMEHSIAQKLFDKLRDRKLTPQTVTAIDGNLQDDYLRYLNSEYKPRLVNEGS